MYSSISTTSLSKLLELELSSLFIPTRIFSRSFLIDRHASSLTIEPKRVYKYHLKLSLIQSSDPSQVDDCELMSLLSFLSMFESISQSSIKASRSS
ncbi:hypothetical protein BpHYR1_042466 [Brachionus plicatilis]|uniref:Uncharacterized protein n=1 Tax=Brachionus plicatilis TaxID=10195 RepID=A0A3M7S6I8_BRAPC|nr:hypothetical protein BpHYR1_042466 [Brachionus plicatilis]